MKYPKSGGPVNKMGKGSGDTKGFSASPKSAGTAKPLNIKFGASAAKSRSGKPGGMWGHNTPVRGKATAK